LLKDYDIIREVNEIGNNHDGGGGGDDDGDDDSDKFSSDRLEIMLAL
jgi:hypothetical protein